jgi:hypothetical protein
LDIRFKFFLTIALGCVRGYWGNNPSGSTFILAKPSACERNVSSASLIVPKRDRCGDRMAFRILLFLTLLTFPVLDLRADDVRLIVEGASYVGRAHPDSAHADAIVATQIVALQKLGVLLEPLSVLAGSQRTEWIEKRLEPLLLTEPEYIDLGFT